MRYKLSNKSFSSPRDISVATMGAELTQAYHFGTPGQADTNSFRNDTVATKVYRPVAGIMKPCALLKLDFLTSAYKKCMR